jgi:Holliday junction resolvasome RuvABC DNA-binding subunit
VLNLINGHNHVVILLYLRIYKINDSTFTRKISEKSPTQIIIDCGGGYHVNISLHTYSLLPNTDFIKVYTHLQIKEDAHTLLIYGKVRARNFRLYYRFLE